MDLKKIIKDIVEHAGGKENIHNVTHCATRLRIELNDESKYNQSALENVEGAKGVFFTNGQLQIIFGSGLVNQVYGAYNDEFGGGESPEPKERKVQGNAAQRFVKMLSDIFVPIIPAIVAGGLLMGINNVLTSAGIFDSTKSLIELYPNIADLAAMINLLANAPFVFLPVLIGFSATKRFGGNPYLGAALGMILVHPDLTNAYLEVKARAAGEIVSWNILGLSIEQIGYQGTVLPIIVMSFVLATIEKFLRRVTPIYLDNLTTPLISLLTTGFLTFAVTGPLLRDAGNLLADGLSWLYNTLGFVGAGIFGLFYAPIVITGMHHSFSAIETTLLSQIADTGGTFIFPIASMNNIAQAGAVFAVMFFIKDAKIKSLASASGVSAALGITEPAMFGVNLRLRYPFYGAIIGSAVGSAWLGFNKVLASALGAAGLPGFLSIPPHHWGIFAIGLLLSFGTAFAVTAYFFKTKKELVDAK
ncbi:MULTISPECIES: sucrose-specific PTS transporter subunit IIBC [unclassified Gemella]|uniref:sucrose-specific PTS transporter subunit IIBC n=1 Tax=unclassified Gemella TaxID=2624949 RepID=UPI0010747311|nr:MULTISPECIES: sucrose-specific PTS transporter subunit IIBC [unclassified Gemella]MBF0709708.1 PTS transporter subunit EIIC [Gemella sp. GL1.1]MBF0746874.1 PTS transporter subunit EIIC [Gemella sp. 19428wG2_WT2a]NYS27052.1 PTS transporter subunit EIIC [Gemella sp. GL1]TFU59104.1 PTS maltose transporter subunit IIBC [Gemella sp. WT2a]